jgi:hypothetical protein
VYTAYDTTGSRTKHTGIATALFMHAAIFLFPAIYIALPVPPPNDWDNSLFTGFSIVFNTWIALFLAVLQFWPQSLEQRRCEGVPGKLSLLSLAMQVLVLVALSIRWLQRLGPRTWGNQTAPLSYWFQWGWLPLIYLAYGVMLAILLASYLLPQHWSTSTRSGIQGERQPLLHT